MPKLDLANALVTPIAKLLLKSFLGDTGADVGVNLLTLALKRFTNKTHALTAQQKATAIAGSVVADLERFYATERVARQAVWVAAFDLGETIDRHIDTAFLIHQGLDAAEIAAALKRARPVGKIFKAAEPEHELYLQLITELAPRLRAVAPDLPGHAVERDAELLGKLTRVADQTPEILAALGRTEEKIDELAGREERKRADYKADYLKAVRKALDYVEILGLDIERTRREAKLSVAYLSLTTSLPGFGRQDFGTLLDLLPLVGRRLLIQGAAGSGKSTLLRWTAVEAASPARDRPTKDWSWLITHAFSFMTWVQSMPGVVGAAGLDLTTWQTLAALQTAKKSAGAGFGEDTGARQLRAAFAAAELEPEEAAKRKAFTEIMSKRRWRTRVPFLIRLRHLEGSLPTPEALPGHLSDALGTPPEDWVRDLLNSGDAMLLIDGMDEVPQGAARAAVLNSIRDYVEIYEDCAVILTSRPHAFDVDELGDLGFVPVEVNELTADQRVDFVGAWHRALAANLGRAEDDAEILGIAAQLTAAFARQPHLALLASNPLLCAGICALHERNPGALPKDEWDLCNKLTEMLVDLRDRSHGRQEPIRLAEFGAAFELSYADKRSILARIAEAMTSQQLSALPGEEALGHVESAMRALRTREGMTADNVLDALQAPSGVLRVAGDAPAEEAHPQVEPAQGERPREAIEFAHNTLKAWLASFHCVDENKPRAGGSRVCLGLYGGDSLRRRRAGPPKLCATPCRAPVRSGRAGVRTSHRPGALGAGPALRRRSREYAGRPAPSRDRSDRNAVPAT